MLSDVTYPPVTLAYLQIFHFHDHLKKQRGLRPRITPLMGRAAARPGRVDPSPTKDGHLLTSTSNLTASSYNGNLLPDPRLGASNWIKHQPNTFL